MLNQMHRLSSRLYYLAVELEEGVEVAAAARLAAAARFVNAE